MDQTGKAKVFVPSVVTVFETSRDDEWFSQNQLSKLIEWCNQNVKERYTNWDYYTITNLDPIKSINFVFRDKNIATEFALLWT